MTAALLMRRRPISSARGKHGQHSNNSDNSHHPPAVVVQSNNNKALVVLTTLFICSHAIIATTCALEFASDTIIPIADEEGGPPVGFAETKTYHSESHHGYVGCLHAKDLY